MPTTIDAENAKQIRKSMEVFVSLDAIEYAQNVNANSASGYSLKVIESTLMDEDYPMRLLADLQGDGFPLDGSCELYDPNKVSSYQNGKIGCRGTVGNTLGLSVTSNSYFSTIMLQGLDNCDHATFNGANYYANDEGNIIIPTGDRTAATITFTAVESTKRVQVRRITAGLALSFNNSNLLSVDLALRSDLNPFDPSLPESEIEIRAYYPYDITRALSAIQDEKPITYQSGYDSDLSEKRHFYLSEPATWEKGVLTIKGIDSVHKLDGETCPIFIGDYAKWKQGITNTDVVYGYIRKLYILLEDQIHMGGIMNPAYDYQDDGYIESPPPVSADSAGVPNKSVGAIIKRQTHREVIANLMNLLHIDLTDFEYDAFWPVYVDAGIPKLTWTKPSSKWDIYEYDCGDVNDHLDQKIVKLNYKSGTVRHTGPTRVKIDGSATAFKKSGVGIDYGEYSVVSRFNYKSNSGSSFYFTGSRLTRDIALPANWTADDDLGDSKYGSALYDSSADKNKLINANLLSWSWNSYWNKWADWTSGMQSNWDYLVDQGEIEIDAESASLEAIGEAFIIEEDTKTYTVSGIGSEITLDKTEWYGEISISSYGWNRIKLLPDRGIQQLLKRSNETGSFTWKGDPRMQPRDVFTFHRLNGNSYDCTIESIELKHERGGTTAEITYRRGIV